MPPGIRLLSPPDGAMFVAPGNLTLLAGISDPEQRVEAVEFHAGNRLLGVVRVSSVDVAADELTLRHREHPELGRVRLVAFEWNEPPPGLHELWVLARDQTEPPSRSPVSRITLWPADRVPVVTVAAVQATGSEGPLGADDLGEPEPEPIVFAIEREGPLIAPLTVFFALGGTAVNGVDYEQVPTSVTLPEGARSVEVTVMPIDDDWLEGPETVVLRLIPPPLADLGEADEESYRVGRPAMAVGVILDNEVAENRPPRVVLLQPGRGEVFLAPAQIRLIAGAWDADGAISQVEFFANERSLGLVQVTQPAPGEPVPRPARYGLDWSDVPAGVYVLTARATDDLGASAMSHPVRIQVLDRERPPVVTVVATEPPAPWEDSSALDTATFTVYRTGSIAEPLAVYYRLGGTAQNGVDYDHLPGRAKILLPVDGQTFVVPAQVEVEVLTLDPDGYVTRVELFAGDEKIGEDGLVFIQPPPPGQPHAFRFQWLEVPPGRHVLRV